MDSNGTPATDPSLDPAFSGMSFAEVCALALQQQAQIKHINAVNAVNAKMAHEMAVLKRLKFAATSERFSPEQKSLLEEAIDEDLQALEREVSKLNRPPSLRVRSRLRSDSRCRPICHATTSTTNQTAPHVPRRAAAAG